MIYNNKTRKCKLLFFILFVAFILSSCSKEEDILLKHYKKTVVIYMVAENNLESEAYNNINEMEKGLTNNNHNLIVYLDTKKEAPKLLKIVKDHTNKIVSKIIATYPEQNSANPLVMKNILNEVKEKYPSDAYGLVLWSHGTAWLPSNYVKTRSFGKDNENEMDIKDLAKALPSGFSYLIFDVCLMGSIEVCYELKDKVPYVLASSVEVLADGLPYKKVVPLFFKNTNVKEKLTAIGKTYFEHYNAKKGQYQTAGTAVIYTPNLEKVAIETKNLLTKKPLTLWQYNYQSIQKLDLYNNTLLFDYLDFLEKNYTQEDIVKVKEAISKAIVYKAHTKYVLQEYAINNFCGLSCYVPQEKLEVLNNYYSTLKWAEDSGFNKLISNKK